MDPAARAEQILVESDAILRGDHFVYVTGEHGDGWVAKDAVFPHTDRVDELCALLAAAVRAAGGDVVTVACLCTRGNASAQDTGCDDFVWLTEVLVPSWSQENCPLCRDGVPVNTQYAHGSDFLAQQASA